MSEVKLKVNDKDIPLNDFMADMLTHLILGYSKALKGIPDKIKTISLEIKQ
jgi:hypothetical protein